LPTPPLPEVITTILVIYKSFLLLWLEWFNEHVFAA